MKKLLATLVILLMVLALLPATVLAAETADVYVSADGSDENAGTEQAPFATLQKALEEAEDGATVHVVGTVSVTSLTWPKSDNTVTITGDTLDFSAAKIDIRIRNNATFQNINLNFNTSENRVFACGYNVTIGEGVSTSGKVYLVGGDKVDVNSVNLTVLSGTWNGIYGGGTSAKVKGNVTVYVGGNTNANVDVTNHTFDYSICGGAWNNKIDGNVNLTIEGNAKARYVFGGGNGSSSSVGGSITTTINGGQFMSVNGGSRKVATNSDITLIINGGTMEQIFGGTSEQSVTGNVDVQILDGTVTRRVYGGCYNDDSSTGYAVNGKITLSIAGNANITLDYDIDRGIYARSRYTSSATEASELIFLDAAAVQKYESKLGAQDAGATMVMGSATAADTITYPPVAQVGETQYSSLQAAIDNANGEMVTLIDNCGNATVSDHVTIDLAGFNAAGITVSEGAALSLVDSGETAGSAQVSGNVVSLTELNGQKNLVVGQDGLYTVHGYDIVLTHVSLKPANDALGYKAQVIGDETVLQNVTGMGFNLWIDGGKTVTRTVSGQTQATLRLNNILANNGGETTINGNAFVTFAGGTATSENHATSMKEVLETVNKQFGSYSKAQKDAVKALVASNQSQVADWAVEKILNWSDNCAVSGTVVKVDGTQLPETLTLKSEDDTVEIPVAADGSFSATINSGNYDILVSNYRADAGRVAVADGENALGTIKLLQVLARDTVWVDGASKTENGASATITTAAEAAANSATEYKVGDSITTTIPATAWTMGAHIEPGATGNVGFSVGMQACGTSAIFFYVNSDSGEAGFYTWDSVNYTEDAENTVTAQSVALSDEVKALLNSEEGYGLALKASGIDGRGTGVLKLYVNDTLVLEREAQYFVALKGSKYKLHLSQVHLSLVAQGTATFTDYYQKAVSGGAVSGNVVKLDGTAGLPATLTLKAEDGTTTTVDVAEDGSFKSALDAGTYTVSGSLTGYRLAADSFTVEDGKTTQITVKFLQKLAKDYAWYEEVVKTESGASVNMTTTAEAHAESGTEYKIGESIVNTNPATSWKVGAHIEPGSTGNVGFSIGTQGGNNGTIFFYVNKDTGIAGYFSWGTFRYTGIIRDGGGLINNNNVGYYTLNDEMKAVLNSEEGYDLKLVATNIDGARSGWLTLYVNDTAVLKLYNNFVGKASGGKGKDGQRPNLTQVHLSLVAQGTGIDATFTDYYYTMNTETNVAAGKLTGTFQKLDGTALPTGDVLLKFGTEYRLVKVTDGVFTTQLPVGAHELEYTLDGYRTVCDTITITEGETTAATIKLLQNLTVDKDWNNGATVTYSGASAIMETAAKTDAMTEWKIGENITNASSWTAETHIVPGDTDRGYVGFSIGGNNANDGMAMIIIDYSKKYVTINSWGTYELSGHYIARRGEAAINSNVSAAENDFKAGATSSNYGLKDWSLPTVKAAEGFKLTLKAENIGTAEETLSLYINDVEMVVWSNLNITGKVSGGKGVEGQKLDLSDVHVSLTTVAKDKTVKTATFTDYYLSVVPTEE